MRSDLPRALLIRPPTHPTPSGPSAARRAAKLAEKSELLRYGEAQRRWYFGKLELHPVKLNLSFRANNNWGESGSLPIPNIESAPLWLSALVRDHLYGTRDDIVGAIGKHYVFALLRQVRASRPSNRSLGSGAMALALAAGGGRVPPRAGRRALPGLDLPGLDWTGLDWIWALAACPQSWIPPPTPRSTPAAAAHRARAGLPRRPAR